MFAYTPAPAPAPLPLPLPALPRLANIPVWCLRTYPELPRLGTPPRAAP